MYTSLYSFRACGQQERKRKKKRFTWQMAILHMALFFESSEGIYVYFLSISTAKAICAIPSVQYISLAKN